MITTVGDGGIVRHTVAGATDVVEAERGAAAGREVVRAAFAAGGPLRLLLDLRAVGFSDMAAHRAWSDGFARHAVVDECAERVALLGRDSVQVRAERAAMETETLRFFFDEGDAVAWLNA